MWSSKRQSLQPEADTKPEAEAKAEAEAGSEAEAAAEGEAEAKAAHSLGNSLPNLVENVPQRVAPTKSNLRI